MISEGYKANFSTLQDAAKNDRLALLECSTKGLDSRVLEEIETLKNEIAGLPGDQKYRDGAIYALDNLRDRMNLPSLQRKVYVVCAVNFDGKEYEMIPVAKMFDGNPYEEVEPPYA